MVTCKFVLHSSVYTLWRPPTVTVPHSVRLTLNKSWLKASNLVGVVRFCFAGQKDQPPLSAIIVERVIIILKKYTCSRRGDFWSSMLKFSERLVDVGWRLLFSLLWSSPVSLFNRTNCHHRPMGVIHCFMRSKYSHRGNFLTSMLTSLLFSIITNI